MSTLGVRKRTLSIIIGLKAIQNSGRMRLPVQGDILTPFVEFESYFILT